MIQKLHINTAGRDGDRVQAKYEMCVFSIQMNLTCFYPVQRNNQVAKMEQ